MRLGVLDVGSNTVHLLVVDAHRGAHPWPAHSQKWPLRLAERLDAAGAVTPDGVRALVEAVRLAGAAADAHGVDDLLAFATSALREAPNGGEALALVRGDSGVALRVLSGADEARLTFLAVRRWFGWSAGRLLVLDIGGGSLEIAAGVDEEPAEAFSVPLGAGRLTRQWLGLGPGATAAPDPTALARLRAYVDELLVPAADRLADARWDRAVVTSKTFRTLARLAGSAPSAAGLYSRRRLTRRGLGQVLGFVRHIAPAALGRMEGVSPERAHQVLAGAVVAEAAMRALQVEEVDVCPWALREGVILRRLDGTDPPTR